jgi:hypothetical protein
VDPAQVATVEPLKGVGVPSRSQHGVYGVIFHRKHIAFWVQIRDSAAHVIHCGNLDSKGGPKVAVQFGMSPGGR